jgi:hypothetical protein
MATFWDKLGDLLTLPNQAIGNIDKEYLATLGAIESGYKTTVQSGEKIVGSIIQESSTGFQKVVTEGSNIANNAIDSVQDLGKDALHTGRFFTKDIVSVLDDIQDHAFETISDIRVDITNGFQILITLGLFGYILYYVLFAEDIKNKKDPPNLNLM